MKTARRLTGLVSAFVLLALVGGCDSAPGVEGETGTPPVVSDLAYTPDLIVFELLPDEDIVGDTLVVVDIDVSASADDIDGDIDSVLYLVNTPFDAFEPLTTGRLSNSGGSQYSGRATLEIPRGNTGLYTVIVYAVDSDIAVSNQVRGLVEYRIEGGGPPVIEDVEGPTSILVPTNFSYVAVVSDPDGLGNIARVFSVGPNGREFEMYDDGETGGDQEAGDGRYTVTFNAPEGTEPGSRTFTFQAIDLQGNESNIVERELTVL